MKIINAIIRFFTKKSKLKTVTPTKDTKKGSKPKYKGYCEHCKKKETTWSNIFYCKYCRKYHCADHRLPEKHECTGNPKAPPKEFVESWTFGKK